MSDRSATVSTEILRQLGNGRFITMTGAKHLTHGESDNGPYLAMKIGRNAKKVNYVKITLTADDLYTVEYGYLRGYNYTVRATSEGIYNDMLRADFESNTGLYTSL